MRWRANRKLFTVRRDRVAVASAHRSLLDAVVAGITSNRFTLADPTPFPAVSLTAVGFEQNPFDIKPETQQVNLELATLARDRARSATHVACLRINFSYGCCGPVKPGQARAVKTGALLLKKPSGSCFDKAIAVEQESKHEKT